VSIKIYGLTATDEPLRISMLGRTVFGDVYVPEHSIANILSYGWRKDSVHAVWQSAEDHVFRVRIVEGGKVYQFRRSCGVCVYRMT